MVVYIFIHIYIYIYTVNEYEVCASAIFCYILPCRFKTNRITYNTNILQLSKVINTEGMAPTMCSFLVFISFPGNSHIFGDLGKRGHISISSISDQHQGNCLHTLINSARYSIAMFLKHSCFKTDTTTHM